MMKKLLLTACLLTVSLGAWAQGRVRFANDSLHLVYFTTDSYFLGMGDSPGAPYAGQTLSDGATLVAELFAGTSSSSLLSVATATFDPATPGQWTAQNLVLPLGGTNYFQIEIHASSNPYGMDYHWGESPIFTAVANSGVAYYSLVQSTFPAYSTWAPGTFPMDSVGAGDMGAIEVIGAIPEPSSLALVGLGLALLAGRRARKLSHSPKNASQT